MMRAVPLAIFTLMNYIKDYNPCIYKFTWTKATFTVGGNDLPAHYLR